MNRGLIGSETPVDDLLRDYFPNRPRNALYQVFESEQSALLAALVMEMRGESTDSDEADDAEATYWTTEQAVTVGTDDVTTLAWGFPATEVLLYGFDQPIHVAFKGPNQANRDIPLNPGDGDEPAEFSPSNGLGASQAWVRTQDSATDATTIKAVAFR